MRPTATTRRGRSRLTVLAAAVTCVSVFAAASPAAAAFETRQAGANRYDTAALLSQQANQCNVAIANGENFPDGLAGAVLGASVLLTRTNALPEETVAELDRLDARCTAGIERIFVLGGPAAVSAAVFQTLEVDYAPGQTIRLAGANRYQTAIEIALYVQANGGINDDTVFLATGMDFPDALAAGVPSGIRRYPIVLNDGDSLRPDVRDFLTDEGITDVLILGGIAAVPKAVEDELNLRGITTSRLAGTDRAETAAIIGAALFTTPRCAALVNGNAFADALAVSMVAQLSQCPILIVARDNLPDDTRVWLEAFSSSLQVVAAIGGLGVISDATLDAAVAAATP